MPDGVGLGIVGLKELRRELKRIEAHKGLQPINKQAAEIPAARAREYGAQSFPNLAGGISRLGSAGVASIRALASQTKGYVAGGKASIPYYGGMDFGSGGGHRQFPGRTAEGRYIYPAIADTGPQIVDTYEREMDKLTSKAFPKGRLF